MKKYSLFLLLTFSVLGLQAQNRKQLTQFSLFQHYFNPAMTGHEGSQIKALYRDQWTGFTDAPQTMFISGEVNASDLMRAGAVAKPGLGVGSAFGFYILRDTFGPFKDTQFNLSYGSQVRLSDALSLRAGAALAYEVSRLDAAKITVDDEQDEEYQNLLGTDNNQVHKLDVNAGLTLLGQDFYLGYAIRDLAKGKLITGDHYYDHIYPLHHVLQGGYRRSLGEEVGLVFNGIYRYDSKLKETLEGQLKGVYRDSFWAGVGYRKDEALSFTAGLRAGQFRVGYAREMATGKAEGINASTNELMVTCQLGRIKAARVAGALSIW
jgi:type IX secretion system PorP/SprF family membrane protein